MMKDYQLTLSERLQIIEILPREGNIVTLRLIHDLKMKLSPTPEEISKFKIIQTKQNEVQFSSEANAVPTNIKFLPAELELIRKQLTELSNQNKLSVNQIGIYDLFFKELAGA